MSSAAHDEAAELISELRALIASGGRMGTLDERKIRAVIDSIRETYEHMDSLSTNPYADASQPYYASSMAYYRVKYLRMKRCLLTYLLWRQRQVSDAWWRAEENQFHDLLTPAEEGYSEEYNNVMVEYMTSFPIEVDLRSCIWRPPSMQQLEVRGLKNYVFASPVTGNTINIYSGKQVLLGFDEAESLIQQKVVELVNA